MTGRMIFLLILVWLALAFAVVAAHAESRPMPRPQADPPCAPHDEVMERFADRFGETRRWSGINTDGQLVDIIDNEKTGSWTAFMTEPGGLTCIVNMGGMSSPEPRGEGA